MKTSEILYNLHFYKRRSDNIKTTIEVLLTESGIHNDGDINIYIVKLINKLYIENEKIEKRINEISNLKGEDYE